MNSQLSINTKLKIFKSSLLAVLLYGCETWRMIKSDENKLDVFFHKWTDSEDLLANESIK